MVLWYIYVQPLWVIAAWMSSAMLLWSVLGLIVMRVSERVWRRVNLFFAVASAAVVLYATVFNRKNGSTEWIWMPFSSFVQAQEEPELYRSLLMNVFLFMPLGLSLPFALPKRMKGRYPCAVLFALLLSVCAEAAQYVFRLGRCETDDVLMNTLGAALGGLAFVFTLSLNKIIKKIRSR